MTQKRSHNKVASSGAKKEVLKDRDASIEWEGPLVILMNELSASASEILAAAMQDYKRAVILGGNQTYGKGTVQNILPINQFYPKYDKDHKIGKSGKSTKKGNKAN